MNLGLGGVINLIWDHYEGFNFGSYIIYSGCADTLLVAIDTIPSNLHTYTDQNPLTCPELFYQVAALHPTGCTPTLAKVLQYNSAKSNISNRTIPTGINYQLSILNYPLKVYPNPYTGKTQISYRLQEKADILLEIYNILGKKVQTVVNERQNSGDYHYNFSAKDSGYGAGIYILKFIIDEQIYTKQLVEF